MVLVDHICVFRFEIHGDFFAAIWGWHRFDVAAKQQSRAKINVVALPADVLVVAIGIGSRPFALVRRHSLSL